MRAILLILILVVVALIAAIASGLVDITQTREAEVPRIEAGEGAIRAEGGQPPAFEVQTGTVGVGTRAATAAVPKVEVKRDSATIPVPTVEVRQPAEQESNAN